MNPLDCLLRDELNRLLDRIAASTRAGVAKVSARQLPDLRARLDEAEAPPPPPPGRGGGAARRQAPSAAGAVRRLAGGTGRLRGPLGRRTARTRRDRGRDAEGGLGPAIG